MGERGPAGPDEATLIKAWRLKAVNGLSVQQVADELKVSHTTAKRWVKDGRELVSELEYIDTQRQMVDRHPIRVDGAAVMDELRRLLFEYVDQGGDVLAAADRIIKAEERKARLLGEGERVSGELRILDLPVPDAETQAAIDAYRGGVR